MSERKDYLPPKDPLQPHFLTGADRRLDIHFRLLRHDYIALIQDRGGGYVGVQLVRVILRNKVLLHNKPRTNVGPMICVYVSVL